MPATTAVDIVNNLRSTENGTLFRYRKHDIIQWHQQAVNCIILIEC